MDCCCGAFKVFAVDTRGGIREREIRHLICRKHMDMGVGHLISGNDESDTLRGKCCLLGFRNVMGYREEVLGKFWVKVDVDVVVNVQVD